MADTTNDGAHLNAGIDLSQFFQVFFEEAGDRWWPVAGGVYFLRATKHVAGLRVLTPSWQRRERRNKALSPAARAKESLTTRGSAK